MDRGSVARIVAGALGAAITGVALLAPDWLPRPLGSGLGPWHVAMSGGLTALAGLPLGARPRLALPRFGLTVALVVLPNLLLASDFDDTPETRGAGLLLWGIVAASTVASFGLPLRWAANQPEPPVQAAREADVAATGRNVRTIGLTFVGMIAIMVIAFVYAETVRVGLASGPAAGWTAAVATMSELAGLFGIVTASALLLVAVGVLLERLRRRGPRPLTDEQAALDHAARDALMAFLNEAAPLARRETTRWRDSVRSGVLFAVVALCGSLFWLTVTRLAPWQEAIRIARAGDAAWSVIVPSALPTSALLAPWLLLPLTALLVLPFTLTPQRAARAQLCTGPRCGACTICTNRLLSSVTRAVRRGRLRPDRPFVPGRWLLRRQLARLGWAALAAVALGTFTGHVARGEANSYALFTPDGVAWAGHAGRPDGRGGVGRAGYGEVAAATIRCGGRDGFRLRYALELDDGTVLFLIRGPFSLRRQDAQARAAWQHVDATLRARGVPRHVEADEETCRQRLAERLPAAEARSLARALATP